MATSGSKELDVKIAEWLKWDKHPKTRLEIEGLQKEGKWDLLQDRLLKRLAFGTAGLRGVMHAGYNGMNRLVVIQTAQGLLKYILKCYPGPEDQKRGVVFGFDGRYESREFAELSAGVFLNANIPVYLYGKTVATPMVPFAVMEKKCLAGVMVTASHNPKEDNGYKVYWSNGAQIITPHDKNIQNDILENLEPFEDSWNSLEVNRNKSLLLDPFDEITALYYKKLMGRIPSRFIETNANCQQRFVYSAMHGVGYPFVERGFAEAKLKPLIAVAEQRDPDPEFPTVKYPNPEEGKSSLELSTKLADESQCSIILANDPDADRLACAEKLSPAGGWKVFTGNELGALLGWWALQCHRANGDAHLSDCYMLASTVSSKILRSMGHIEGFKFVETLTGFKWMGNESVRLMEEQGKTILFAFEEAIGFMFSPTVLDKDGVSAAIHLATMACYLKEVHQMGLNDKLQDLYREYGFHYSLNSYYLCYDPEVITRIFERIRNYNGEENAYPVAIGMNKIKYYRDLTTGADSEQADGQAMLPSSKSSQMITFTFENGIIMTLRTSGTEPKIKYYSEICAAPGNCDWESVKQELAETVEMVVHELLQPDENNLIAKTD